MNVKEAVAVAKAFVAETFADESPTNLGLEEVEFDDRNDIWHVTVGFSRPWQQRSGIPVLAGVVTGRSYKVVSVRDDNGTVLSIKNRAVIDAA